MHTINATDLPSIDMVGDEILNQAIICEVSTRPFRIVRLELELYRKNSLPLPTRHPDERHMDRLSHRPVRALHMRTCDQCDQPVVSVHTENQDSAVYCTTCYDQKVFG